MTIKGRTALLYDLARQHPQFIKLGLRIAWRNATNLVDYNLNNGRSLPPKAVTFRMSGKCNLDCQMCNFRHTGFLDTDDMLPLEIYKKVIDDVHQQVFHVSLTGGEPLLHPDIVEFVRYAKLKGMSCSLVTNGSALAHYAKDIVNAGVDILTVSIDGPEEMHDSIRGMHGLYGKIIAGLREVQKCEKRPVLFFSTTIQADNYTHLETVVENAIQAGVDGINFNHLQTLPRSRTALHNLLHPSYPVRNGWSNESLREVDTEALQTILQRAKQKGLLVNVFPMLSPQDMTTWYADPMQLLPGQRIRCPWVMGNVYHDGTMRTCDDIILGDLKTEGFWDIWNGDRMVAFRQQAKKSKTFPICATCCSLYRSHAL
jgi:MoaA/NifB/PqqE/SkfB family radical SAM enzyme